MRGRLEASLVTRKGNGGELARHLLHRAGLLLSDDQSMTTREIHEYFDQVHERARQLNLVGTLDLGPRSSVIQDVARAAYPDEAHDDQKYFNARTRRSALAHVLSILLQVPTDRRMDEAAHHLSVIQTSNGCFGLLYWRPQSPQIIVRIRNRDGRKIKAGLAEIASALVSRKHLDEVEVSFSEGTSAGVTKIGGDALYTSFNKAVLLSPTRDEETILEGDIKEVQSRATAVRYLFRNGSTRLISLIGMLFLGLSAALFVAAQWHWMPEDEALVGWLDQLFGRLATAAFGAVLIDAALKYQALLKSLKVGRFSRGAVIDWQEPSVI
jgi:hypothetical protein